MEHINKSPKKVIRKRLCIVEKKSPKKVIRRKILRIIEKKTIGFLKNYGVLSRNMQEFIILQRDGIKSVKWV